MTRAEPSHEVFGNNDSFPVLVIVRNRKCNLTLMVDLIRIKIKRNDVPARWSNSPNEMVSKNWNLPTTRRTKVQRIVRASRNPFAKRVFKENQETFFPRQFSNISRVLFNRNKLNRKIFETG